VAADFTYYLQPSLCAQLVSPEDCNNENSTKVCLSLHHGYPDTYVEIYPWYEYRKLSWRVRLFLRHDYISIVSLWSNCLSRCRKITQGLRKIYQY